MFLAVYVDDILVTGDDKTEIQAVKMFLDSTFKIKDLGSLHYLLGIEFNRLSTRMAISQGKFTLHFRSEFLDSHCTPVASPLDVNTKLHHDQGLLQVDPSS